MNIRRLIYSPFGKYVISMLLGIGLASLFRKACQDRNCLKFIAAPMSKIKNQVFKLPSWIKTENTLEISQLLQQIDDLNAGKKPGWAVSVINRE